MLIYTFQLVLTHDSITYLEKQLETALAVPKEDPSATQTLHSKIEKLERSVESLRAMIAEKEQQAVVKDHQIEDLTTEFLVLKVQIHKHTCACKSSTLTKRIETENQRNLEAENRHL